MFPACSVVCARILSFLSHRSKSGKLTIGAVVGTIEEGVMVVP